MSAAIDFDVAVIGAGPGGYACALRAAQLGLRVIVIDRRPIPGGTCLNVGCIPSKALLHASERYDEARHEFAALGIKATRLGYDLTAMQQNKDRVVAETVKGIAYLFRKNNVVFRQGEARLTGANTLSVDGDTIRAKYIVLATGSVAANLFDLPLDAGPVVSSTGALSFETVPKNLLVIGAGVIGLELGSVWHRLGAKVTLIEAGEQIAPGFDTELARVLQSDMQKRGVNFYLRTKVLAIGPAGKTVTVSFQEGKDGQVKSYAAEKVLVAVGRKPATQNLGLEELGISQDAQGHIYVDANYQSTCPGIYAIGDIISGPKLAHKAEEEARKLAEHFAGRPHNPSEPLIPSVLYTHPEFAMVGQTESQLQKSRIAYKCGKFPFKANGRARAIHSTIGAIKVLTCAHTDTILGVHILGPNAGELIAEATLAMSFHASAEDLSMACHPHPTLSEALKEAALAAFDRPLNA